jgi:hypothetical protein
MYRLVCLMTAQGQLMLWMNSLPTILFVFSQQFARKGRSEFDNQVVEGKYKF